MDWKYAFGALLLIGAIVIGSGAVSVGEVSNPIAPAEPATDSAIKTSQNEYSIVRNVTLYESGAANITLASDHGCFDQIEISHGDSDTVYKTVSAPEFGGPKTIDLKSIVKSNGPYPNTEFEIAVDGPQGCIATTGRNHLITVPQSWLP